MKVIKISILTVCLVLGILGCTKSQDEHDVKLVVASYLASPGFVGNDLVSKLFGPEFRVEMFNIDEQLLYLTVSAEDLSEETMRKVAVDPGQIQWAKSPGQKNDFSRVPVKGEQELGRYYYGNPNRKLFRLAVDNIQLDVNRRIQYKFENTFYDVTPVELSRFLMNKALYTGYLEVEIGKRGGLPVIMISRAPFIAKKGEASLERLADRITRNLRTQEEKIQALLDFVVREIDYAEADNIANKAVMKRPNEVLMVRGGNCANKMILMASLLEQISAEYIILYMPKIKHASLAVTGNFSNLNGLSFIYEDKTFSLAEPTISTRFVIGQTVLAKEGLSNIELIQRPRGKIFSVKEQRFLDFVR